MLLLLLVIVAECTKAQRWSPSVGSIKGRLGIGSAGGPLADATVVLFSSDSSVVTTRFTNKEGRFVFDSLQEKAYKVYITHIGYRSVWLKLEITEKDTLVDLGVINMEVTGITLKVIEVISEKRALIIKKDTLEFDAGAFFIRDDAIVEDLLKKLPGIQIGRDGTIRINGETVKKLLVDGKPFFANDPRIATRNLTADMIDKIQFIDRGSDWSQFTGVDDGQREKTINITIKKGKKDGWFGQVGTALGSGNHFALSGNIYRFNDEEQISLWTSETNVGGYQEEGLQSKLSIGGNSNVRNWITGAGYHRDFSSALKMDVNYSMNSNYTGGNSAIERENLLPDTIWYYNQNTRTSNTNDKHVLNASVELKLDTMYIMNISTSFSYDVDNSLEESLYASLGGKRQLLNSGDMNISNAVKSPSFSVGAFLGRKFNKKGRALTLNMNVGYSSADQRGFNRSHNLFVAPDANIFIDSINQRNDVNSINRSLSLSLIYVEPVFKDRYLQFTYAYFRNYSWSNKSTYDYSPSKNEYDQQNDSLSNSSGNWLSVQRVGVKVFTQKAKCDYNMGLDVQFSDLDNNNITRNNSIHQRTVNLFPSTTFYYSISSQKKIRFSYLGNTQQPSISQLQPVPDNSNPLYIKLGNPNLKAVFGNSLSVGYTSLNPSTLHNLSANINADFIVNKIVYANRFDSLGRQISQPVNVNGSYNFGAGISTNLPLKSKNTSINSGVSLGYAREVGYINGVRGAILNFTATPNVSFNYSYKGLIKLAANADAGYNRVQYVLEEDNNTDFFNYRFSLDGNIQFPLGFIVGGNFDFMSNIGGAMEHNQNAAMLNAFVSKSLFKSRQGLLTLRGFDLLNRNAGISRTIGMNYVETIETNAVKRLFLISLSYSIRKAAGHK